MVYTAEEASFRREIIYNQGLCPKWTNKPCINVLGIKNKKQGNVAV